MNFWGGFLSTSLNPPHHWIVFHELELPSSVSWILLGNLGIRFTIRGRMDGWMRLNKEASHVEVTSPSGAHELNKQPNTLLCTSCHHRSWSKENRYAVSRGQCLLSAIAQDADSAHRYCQCESVENCSILLCKHIHKLKPSLYPPLGQIIINLAYFILPIRQFYLDSSS